jgi:mannitol/fructose-specific phosphotransferase system IIA component (Ntr-type)
MLGHFKDGEEVTVTVNGKYEIMASEFFKLAWENLGNLGNNLKGADGDKTEKARLAALIDEAYIKIEEPDLADLGAFAPHGDDTKVKPECRSVATINDRLHDLTLPMLPHIARHFRCKLQIAFEVPLDGVFWFAFEPDGSSDSAMRVLDRILELPVEVGTKITILTDGPERFKANEAVKDVLKNLWQCDCWLRAKGKDLENAETISELLTFAEKTGAAQSHEYGFIQNPFISNLLTSQHVIVNPSAAEFSKADLLNQLSAPHVSLHQLEHSLVLDRVLDTEKREPIVLRDGFAIAHAAMDRTPRILITFGTYPKGVVWDTTGRIVRLVCLVLFAKDTYGTWRDYLKKLAIVFRTVPSLQERLIGSQNSAEFRDVLREAEMTMIH